MIAISTSPAQPAFRRARISAAGIVALCVLAGLSASPARGYESDIHQKLTFVAAKLLNRCVEGSGVPGVNALQVRIIAKANTRQADANLFVRMFRWNYYDRSGVGDRDILWVIDTRFHEHFDEVVRRVGAAEQASDRYKELGRIVGYVQDVTSPPHAVPVYATRWWRLALKDRFDRYPVDEDAVSGLVEASCDEVTKPAPDFHAVLEEAARDTLAAVREPVTGLPVTWEVFWRPDEDPGKFGSYGPAGNKFGRDARFPCGQSERCVLLDDDPLYAEFAMQRHAAAVMASVRAMMIAQRIQQGVSGQ